MLAFQMGVEPKIRGKPPPKWMVCIMEKPRLKWMIWGAHTYFWKHPDGEMFKNTKEQQQFVIFVCPIETVLYGLKLVPIFDGTVFFGR